MLEWSHIKCMEQKLTNESMAATKEQKHFVNNPWCTTNVPVKYHKNLNLMFQPKTTLWGLWNVGGTWPKTTIA